MSEQIRLMFSDIAPSYDLGNDVLSFGTHRLWKRLLVRLSGAKRGDRVLDVATGTGDIAANFNEVVGTEGEVVGVDFCEPMITEARKRWKDRTAIRFETGDALDLHFPSDSFDVSSISFGIRNVDRPVDGLAEMARVVKPGGSVVVLETGSPRGAWGGLYHFYTRKLFPFLGGLISGNREAYSYLDKTAARFPCGEEFVAMMRQAGLHDIDARPLLGGVAWLYKGMVR